MRLAKNILFGALMVMSAPLTSCQESLEERAEREAREYTEKHCPTPPQNDVITDSIVFDRNTRTWTQYLTFTGIIDDEKGLREHNEEIHKSLLESIRQNTEMKRYKEAGFSFAYICRSKKDPKTILLTLKYTPKDYR